MERDFTASTLPTRRKSPLRPQADWTRERRRGHTMDSMWGRWMGCNEKRSLSRDGERFMVTRRT